MKPNELLNNPEALQAEIDRLSASIALRTRRMWIMNALQFLLGILFGTLCILNAYWHFIGDLMVSAAAAFTAGVIQTGVTLRSK